MSIGVTGRIRWRLGLAVLCGIPMLAGPAWAADEVLYPQRSVLLFVASWCAPCREELSRLSAISAAALPWQVLVIPMDDMPATRAMLAAVPPANRRWQPNGAERQKLTDDLFREAGGLPFSIVTDAEGRPCASVRSGLDAERVRQALATCGAAGASA